MAGKFGAQVGAWARKTEARMLAVWRRSVELVGEALTNTKPNGGKVPFLTGNLARSLLASTSGMPSVSDVQSIGQPIGIITASLGIKQKIWLGYQAEYARRVNNGFIGADSLGRVFNQDGAYFVEDVVARWQSIVDQAANELQAAVESRQK